MNDHQWKQLLGLWKMENDNREKKGEEGLFVLRSEVGERLDAIHALLEASALELDVEEAFSLVNNTYGIDIITWVVDGSALALEQLLMLADAYSIDATVDGKVVLSLSLSNAAFDWTGEKQ